MLLKIYFYQKIGYVQVRFYFLFTCRALFLQG